MQIRALKFLLLILCAIPYRRRVQLVGWLTRAVLGHLSSYNARTLHNLDYVWPDLPQARREEIARAAGDNFGRCIIEHFSMDEVGRRMKAVEPTGPGLPAFRTAVAEGRPAVLVTGHFGNYEAARLCLLDLGCKLGAVYRPIASRPVDILYVDAITRTEEGPLFEQGRDGLVRLVRHLKTGGAVIFLNDLYVGKGVDMEFLGKPAMTSLSAAELALRFEAPLIPFYGTREQDGIGFRVELEAPVDHSSAVKMTEELNHSLGARISSNPEQWFWIHRRWKRRSDIDKSMIAQLHPAALPRAHSNKLTSSLTRNRSRPAQMGNLSSR